MLQQEWGIIFTWEKKQEYGGEALTPRLSISLGEKS